MSRQRQDLTGRWDGIFNYPRDLPPSPLPAESRILYGDALEQLG